MKTRTGKRERGKRGSENRTGIKIKGRKTKREGLNEKRKKIMNQK